jgi:hypothetical protein
MSHKIVRKRGKILAARDEPVNLQIELKRKHFQRKDAKVQSFWKRNAGLLTGKSGSENINHISESDSSV